MFTLKASLFSTSSPATFAASSSSADMVTTRYTLRQNDGEPSPNNPSNAPPNTRGENGECTQKLKIEPARLSHERGIEVNNDRRCCGNPNDRHPGVGLPPRLLCVYFVTRAMPLSPARDGREAPRTRECIAPSRVVRASSFSPLVVGRLRSQKGSFAPPRSTFCTSTSMGNRSQQASKGRNTGRFEQK